MSPLPLPEVDPLLDDELALARTRARAAQLRRRRTALRSLPVVLLVAVLALPVVLQRGKDPNLRIVDSSSTTTTSTTAAPAPSIVGGGGDATACERSTRRVCGVRRWATTPAANGELAATVVRQSPADPEPGESIRYTVRITDGDAPLDALDVRLASVARPGQTGTYEYGGLIDAQKGRCERRSQPFGVWPVPTARRGSVEFTYEYAATQYTEYDVIEAASDLCSFVAYQGSVFSNAVTENGGEAWFNPYASHRAWRVCVDDDRHVTLQPVSGGCTAARATTTTTTRAPLSSTSTSTTTTAPT